MLQNTIENYLEFADFYLKLCALRQVAVTECYTHVVRNNFYIFVLVVFYFSVIRKSNGFIFYFIFTFLHSNF